MKGFDLRLVAWEMTRACNLACVHCRASACSEPDSEQLTTAQARELMDQIRTVGSPILIMTGGEPLMRPDFFELAEYATRIGLRPVLATNGVMITEETARRIAAVGIPRVSISLDGPSPAEHDAFRGVPGAFDASLKGISLLKDAHVPIQINTTLTRRNRRRLSEIMKTAEDVGAAAYHVFLLVPTGRAKDMTGEEMNPEEYEESLVEFYRLSRATKMETKATCAPQYYRILRQQAKKEGIEVSERTFGLNARTRGCLAGLSFVFVSHKGDLQPCGYFDEQAGNVKDSPFPELWRNAPLFNRLRDFGLLEGKCGRCEYVRVCGGCRARALEHSGRFTAEEPYCAHVPKMAAIEMDG